VTRGAIQTAELYVPGIPLEGAWEANFTMGTAWQYQPQNESYKTFAMHMQSILLH
jgi:alpha-L-fucosidase